MYGEYSMYNTYDMYSMGILSSPSMVQMGMEWYGTAIGLVWYDMYDMYSKGTLSSPSMVSHI